MSSHTDVLLTVVVIAFAVLTFLTIAATFWPKLFKIDKSQQKKLFAVLIVEIVVLGLSVATSAFTTARSETKSTTVSINIAGSEDIDAFTQRLSGSITKKFREEVGDFHTRRKGLLRGSVDRYNHSWIIGRELVAAISEYDLSDLTGPFDSRTSSSLDGGFAIALYFVRDTYGKLQYQETPRTGMDTSLKVVKLALYNERIKAGNYLLMDVDRASAGQPRAFTCDLSIESDLVSNPLPFLHEVVSPVQFDSISADQVLFRNVRLQQTQGPVPDRTRRLWNELAEAMTKLPTRQHFLKEVDRASIQAKTDLAGFKELIENPGSFLEAKSFDTFTPERADLRLAKDVVFTYYLK